MQNVNTMASFMHALTCHMYLHMDSNTCSCYPHAPYRASIKRALFSFVHVSLVINHVVQAIFAQCLLSSSCCLSMHTPNESPSLQKFECKHATLDQQGVIVPPSLYRRLLYVDRPRQSWRRAKCEDTCTVLRRVAIIIRPNTKQKDRKRLCRHNWMIAMPAVGIPHCVPCCPTHNKNFHKGGDRLTATECTSF